MNTKNFLKDSNTNWKYVLIVGVLAILVGGGILGYQYWWLPKQEKCEICKLSFVKWCENCCSLNWPRGNQNSPILPIDNVMCMKDCFGVLLPKTNYCFDRQNLCKDFGVTESKEAKDETADWKTYRNEEYGIEFKFPSDWRVRGVEYPSDVGGAEYGMAGRPVLALAIGPQIRIVLGSRDCSEVGELDPFFNPAFLLGEKIRDLTISGFRAAVFRRGCYECYEGDPRLETDGVVAIVVNSQENGYAQIMAEGPKEDLAKIRDFFVKVFLPTVKLDQEFNTIECLPPDKG